MFSRGEAVSGRRSVLSPGVSVKVTRGTVLGGENVNDGMLPGHPAGPPAGPPAHLPGPRSLSQVVSKRSFALTTRSGMFLDLQPDL